MKVDRIRMLTNNMGILMYNTCMLTYDTYLAVFWLVNHMIHMIQTIHISCESVDQLKCCWKRIIHQHIRKICQDTLYYSSAYVSWTLSHIDLRWRKMTRGLFAVKCVLSAGPLPEKSVCILPRYTTLLACLVTFDFSRGKLTSVFWW